MSSGGTQEQGKHVYKETKFLFFLVDSIDHQSLNYKAFCGQTNEYIETFARPKRNRAERKSQCVLYAEMFLVDLK